MESWLVTLILGEMIFFAFLFWLIAHYRAKRAGQQADERLRLLERFEDGEKLAAFLESEPGARYLELFKASSPDPRRGLRISVFGGVISLFLGAAFLTLADFSLFEADTESFLVPGILMAFLGVGMLAAAFVASKLWRSGDTVEQP